MSQKCFKLILQILYYKLKVLDRNVLKEFVNVHGPDAFNPAIYSHL